MNNLFDSAEFDAGEDLFVEEINDTNDSSDKGSVTQGQSGVQSTDGKKANVNDEDDEDENLIDLELITEIQGDSSDDPNVKTDTNLESSSNVKSGSSSVFVPFASALQERGILNDEDVKTISESDDPEEALFNAYAKSQDEAINSFIDNLPDNLKYVMANYKEGVPLDKLIEAQSKFDSVATLSEKDLIDNEANQEKVFKEYYSEKGFSSERIERELRKSKELGLLGEESIDMRKELESNREAEKLRIAEQEKSIKEQQAKDNLATLNKIKETVNTIDEIIPGVKLTKAVRDQIYQNVTMPYKDGKSFAAVKRAEDPISFEVRLNYFIQKGFFDKDADFKSLTKATKSKVVNEFQQALERNNKSFISGGKTINNKGMNSLPEDSTNWDDALSGF